MFGQVLVAVVRKPEAHKHDRIYVLYNRRGEMVRGTYTIPEGDHPEVYVPLFEFQQAVKQLKLNVRKPMSDEERKKRNRESLARHRVKKREERLASREATRQEKPEQQDKRIVLSDYDVTDVHRLHSLGYTNVEISRIKSVSDSLISRIVNRKRRTRVAV